MKTTTITPFPFETAFQKTENGNQRKTFSKHRLLHKKHINPDNSDSNGTEQSSLQPQQ